MDSLVLASHCASRLGYNCKNINLLDTYVTMEIKNPNRSLLFAIALTDESVLDSAHFLNEIKNNSTTNDLDLVILELNFKYLFPLPVMNSIILLHSFFELYMYLETYIGSYSPIKNMGIVV